MIDKKELRIGNYIQSVFKGPVKDTLVEFTYTVRVCEILDHAVRSDVIDDIKLPKFGNSEQYGIPLTEEWLLKFGFEKIKTYSNNNSLFKTSNVFLEFDGGIGVGYYSYDTNIKYVHQLQNLYFALTGEELELK